MDFDNNDWHKYLWIIYFVKLKYVLKPLIHLWTNTVFLTLKRVDKSG